MSAKTPQVRRRSRSRTRESLAPVSSPNHSSDHLNLSMQSIGDFSARTEQDLQVVLQNKEDMRQLNERFAQYLRLQKEKEAGEGGWQLRYNELYEAYQRDMNDARQESLNKLRALTLTNRDLLDQLSDLKTTVSLMEKQFQDLAADQSHSTNIIKTLEEECEQYKQALAELRNAHQESSLSSNENHLNREMVRLQSEFNKLQREHNILKSQADEYYSEKQSLSHQLHDTHQQTRKLQETTEKYESILVQHGIAPVGTPGTPANTRRSRGRNSIFISPSASEENLRRLIEAEIQQQYDEKLQVFMNENKIQTDQLYKEFQNDLTHYKTSLLDSGRRLKEMTELYDQQVEKFNTLMTLHHELTEQVESLTIQLNDTKQGSNEELHSLRKSLEEALEEKNYFADLCKQKDSDFEYLMNVKLSLQAELQHYERLLSMEEHRLGIAGIASNIPLDQPITDKCIPLDVKKVMLQQLGIDVEYASSTLSSPTSAAVQSTNTMTSTSLPYADDASPSVSSQTSPISSSSSSSKSGLFGSFFNLFSANTTPDSTPPDVDGTSSDSLDDFHIQQQQPPPQQSSSQPGKKRQRGTNFIDEDFLDSDSHTKPLDHSGGVEDANPPPAVSKRTRHGRSAKIQPIPPPPSSNDELVHLLGEPTREELHQTPSRPTSTSLLLSGRDEMGQYIQIINGASEDVDLSNWYLHAHGRKFKFSFPEGAILPAQGRFTLRTVGQDDLAGSTFEPDEDNNITIYVTHELWTEADDLCSLHSSSGQLKAEVRVAQLTQEHVNTQPNGCTIM